VIGTCTPAEPRISGLGWNAGFGLLWAATASADDLIYAINPDTCRTLRTIAPPDGQPSTGAGLDVDARGNLWIVSTGSPGTVYLLTSGLPSLTGAPWLSVGPASGLIAAGDRQRLTARVDATGLAPGRYTASLYLLSGDTRKPLITVPVRLDVRR
jgi:hypothetical protein